ncbi:hypothetical protein HBA55_09740 [Pseudomaricurvus alkylphenolicus]|uniref:hypothetical protein n=1 Tax=Pseudomaricurvus alkylphenolicus TaxID=1306991 RepID=UPI00141D9CFD|nr:hypothetical protein [Pseudomaricurvus alkylphenolicus]NIB39867.1 hypothetical protein [Pseudomaricurvus alkylphenolicus]
MSYVYTNIQLFPGNCGLNVKIPRMSGFLYRLACLLIITSVVCTGFAYAESWEFQPAEFKGGYAKWEQRIKFPKSKIEDVVVVRNAAYVSKNGSAKLYVYVDSSDNVISRRFERAVQRGLRKLKFVPARVNGEKKRVWLRFSVIFDRSSGKEVIKIIPNSLYDIDAHGISYFAPQRYNTPRFPRACRANSFLWIAAKIDNKGRAIKASFVSGRASEECKRQAVDNILNSSYIPARQNGEYVTGTYAELYDCR